MRTVICRLTAMGRAVCIVASVLAFTSTAVLTQANSWVNPTSGNWDQATNWSLGILPDSSQPVMITNGGFKAVTINPSTPVNFPGSMTVSSLTIQGATNSDNLLLLNFFGTAVPLTVLNGLTLRDNAQIQDLNSGLIVQSGTITVTNSQINQDGGFIITTNAPMSLQDASYNLTNGDFEGGQVSLGNSAFAQFNQYGGSALITNLIFGTSAGGAINGGGTYNLYGGNLDLPGGLTIIGSDNSVSAYFQAGGTNLTSGVFLEPGIFGISPSFTLNGGLLADNNTTLEADNFGGITITQNGGTHVITNSLDLAGGTETGESANPAIYSLNGGTLTTGTMSMDATMGTAEFNQTNGIASLGDIQGVSSPTESIWVPEVNLSGGTLASSNIHITDGGLINQTGGALVVSNSLAFDGFIQPGPMLYSTYLLLGGTLAASNISVGGNWIIGDSTTNRISNPGTISLSHTIVISNAVTQLGRFILASNGAINFAGSASELSFANSSGETWAPGATLAISNWTGNLSGGGAEQLKFGTDQSGLTAQQLSQIEFINPAGLPPGTYSAQILPDGEIVPSQGSSGSGIVNSWINPRSGNWDQPTNWSQGILPASSQSVMITNAGFKAVAINSTTPVNFPGSMTVSNLTIAAPTNSGNLLLLNFFGTNVPLTVLNGLTLGDNGQILDLNSGLVVQGGSFTVTNAQISQDGGFIITTNAPMSLQDSAYNLTNGEFEGGQVSLGNSVAAQFNQYGGSVFITKLVFGTSTGGGTSGGGTYSLFGGNLDLPGGLTIIGADNSTSAYFQSEGTNVTSAVFLEPGIFGRSPSFTLNGGWLADSNVTLEADNFGGITLTQNGGTHIITSALNIFGSAASSTEVHPGVYQLSGGQLTVSNMGLSGGANFSETGGTVTQTGTLTLDSSSITAGNGTQQFGRLLLSGSTNSTLTLASGPGVLHFANSSSEAWSSTAMLLISNWNGSLSGGGEDQIFFGSDSTGLTGQQLSQIKFIDPAGLAPGTYSARILSDGEVVPNEVVSASIAFSRQGNNLVLTWPTGWILQSATNVVGPYSDVAGATSPYTNNMTQQLQFFRLRQ